MKTFPQRIATKRFTNKKLNITEKIKGTWNWKEKSYLHYTMFQSQGYRKKQVYWTYKKITFRGLL